MIDQRQIDLDALRYALATREDALEYATSRHAAGHQVPHDHFTRLESDIDALKTKIGRHTRNAEPPPSREPMGPMACRWFHGGTEDAW